MKTILIAVLASTLAATIAAAQIANSSRDEPVRDAAVVKQLKELNRSIGSSPYSSQGLRPEIRQGFDDLYRVTAESCRALAEHFYDCPTPTR